MRLPEGEESGYAEAVRAETAAGEAIGIGAVPSHTLDGILQTGVLTPDAMLEQVGAAAAAAAADDDEG